MKRESVLNSNFAPYREMLVAKKRQLLEDLTSDSARLDLGGRIADDDQPPLLHDQFVTLQKQDITYQTLKLIESALDRLAAGDFGICLSCGEAISARRLAAVPWAQYCIHCQENSSRRFAETDQRAA